MENSIYSLGFIGALFYYIRHSKSFGQGLIGILKAFVWPAFVVFQLLKFLKM